MADGGGSFAPFWRELNDRVREHARQRGTTHEAEMQQWVLQRVMVRLFDAQPDTWMIKGGQTALARWPDARSTADVDLVRTSAGSVAQNVADYNSAMERDYGDHLRFVPHDTEAYEPYGWARIGHTVFCGDIELMNIDTDTLLPEGRPLRRPPEIADFPRHIHASGHPRENPKLRMISLADTLGHKVSGIFSRFWQGGPSVRPQDLVDLLFIADRVPWEGPETHALRGWLTSRWRRLFRLRSGFWIRCWGRRRRRPIGIRGAGGGWRVRGSGLARVRRSGWGRI
ncbi:nucleotidyl transferase AbiEii/AbiGii toxin family protein [Streptomonospora sp. PA3]|uniref:nucleotidyl transferase AbiEii/AbiGii toxin family protein n=1 Tax=Streptomonospora sp. PA3 TaxID=2607326 RepID=UPI0012DC03D2|nr:nucleotidyl transferase AbiEii/AbiGii toxin family protein [Streptomonospora sp. PA3]MUL42908.1 nucleotidyl transferase AbiEii/AbiGii toxin family protein [Streptomonospora sp. PA3]